MSAIYLDSAAMSRPLPGALMEYENAVRNFPYNPSSEHACGQAARKLLEESRARIATCIDAEPEEIIFTSGATESAKFALFSLSEEGYDIDCSPYEHHAVSENIPPHSHETPFRAYAQIWANNETGEIMAIPSSTPLYKRYVFDTTTALGHVKINVRGNAAASYIFGSAHKFGGVPGAGFLYVRKGAPLSPLIRGGGQERGMRSGTENVPAICAMAAALEWQTEHMEENTQKLSALRAMMFKMLSEIPDHKWNTPFDKPCLPHILNISFDGVDAHTLALLLSKVGVMVSAGAACSNGLHEPSHVIMAMFNDEARARSAIRISFSHENTENEVIEAATRIKDAVEFLRSVS